MIFRAYFCSMNYLRNLSLFSDLYTYSSDSSFYIDSDLDQNLRGEDLAKELFELGYKDLHISTGYTPERFQNIDFDIERISTQSR